VANRLLPQQFAAGTDISGTRIEQALAALVGVYNDVPADLVKRRWCPSHISAGYSPSQEIGVTTPRQLPWLDGLGISAVLQPPATFPPQQRVKSCAVEGLTVSSLYTWEIAFGNARPVIVTSLSMFAEALATGPFDNPWQDIGPVAPADDFTFQMAVDDAWDIENRRKLKQEMLLWKMRSDAFAFNPSTQPLPADTIQPPHPVGVWDGHCLTPTPLVLLPPYARSRVQMTIPMYNPGVSTWGSRPWKGNAWSLHVEVLEPTR